MGVACSAILLLEGLTLRAHEPAGAATVPGDDKHATEPAQSVSVANWFHPLERRTGDPEFRLSHLRVEQHPLFNQPNLVFDLERIAGEPRQDGAVQLLARTTRGGEPEGLFSADLQAFAWSNKPKATISAPVAPAFGIGQPDFGLELYIVLIHDKQRRYRCLYHKSGRAADQVPKPLTVKVSNSLRHGRELPVSTPRKWLIEEEALLAAPVKPGAAPQLTLIEFPNGRLGVTSQPLSGDQRLLKDSQALRIPESQLRWLAD